MSTRLAHTPHLVVIAPRTAASAVFATPGEREEAIRHGSDTRTALAAETYVVEKAGVPESRVKAYRRLRYRRHPIGDRGDVAADNGIKPAKRCYDQRNARSGQFRTLGRCRTEKACRCQGLYRELDHSVRVERLCLEHSY